MEMNFNTIRKESPEVGMVEFTIRKVSGFLGPYKDVVMSYKKNDRQVRRTFIMDTDGRIKLRKACERFAKFAQEQFPVRFDSDELESIWEKDIDC